VPGAPHGPGTDGGRGNGRDSHRPRGRRRRRVHPRVAHCHRCAGRAVRGGRHHPRRLPSRLPAGRGQLPGLDWALLAGVDSDRGRAPLPRVRAGPNPAAAAGPTPFQVSTFAGYDLPVPAEPPPPPALRRPTTSSRRTAVTQWPSGWIRNSCGCGTSTWPTAKPGLRNDR